MKDYNDEDKVLSSKRVEEEFGCGFCWDKRKEQDKELYFFDAANNLRLCRFCPNCGRPYNQEDN